MDKEIVGKIKIRPELPEKFRKIYDTHYKNNREGNTPMSFFSQKVESWLHRQVAKDVSFNHDKSTLELGAGTLNQLNYERPTHFDIVEPFKILFKDSKDLSNVQKVYDDISEIDESTKYDRIISVATLEHILNLPYVVAKSALLLNDSGTFRASIPNEGYFLWKLCYMASTGVEFFLRYSLNYSTLMKYEHVNNADEIESILRNVFKDVKVNFFGASKSVAIYRFFECSSPKIDIAQEIIDLNQKK